MLIPLRLVGNEGTDKNMEVTVEFWIWALSSRQCDSLEWEKVQRIPRLLDLEVIVTNCILLAWQ